MMRKLNQTDIEVCKRKHSENEFSSTDFFFINLMIVKNNQENAM